MNKKAIISGLAFVAGIVLMMILTSCAGAGTPRPMPEPERASYFVDGEPPAADIENINKIRQNAHELIDCMNSSHLFDVAMRKNYTERYGAAESDRVFASGDALAADFVASVEKAYQQGAPDPAITIARNSGIAVERCERSRP